MIRRTFPLPLAAALAFATLLALTPAVSAQTVMLRVSDAERSAPMVGALAYLVGADGSTVKNALTDERGRALFVGVPSGSYSVRVEMIGMATAETDSFELAEGATLTRDLRLASSAIQLEGIEVEAESGRCSVRPGGEGLLVSEVWDEARKALSAASFTDEQGSYRYETMRYDRQIDPETGAVVQEDQSRRAGYMLTPFESRPAEDLVENGFVQRDGADFTYFAPDATVLLSDPFLDTHCFRITYADEPTEEGLVGLGFEPTGDDKSVADIAGTMWIDPETSELRWLEYRYQFLDPEMTTSMVGGRVDFQRMPNGTWIVPEWWIRMPVMAVRTEFDGRQRPSIARYHQTGGLVLEAREAGGRSLGQRAETGGVEGVVMDSLGAPLQGVRVGVLGGNQQVFTNAEGAFSITGLAEGRYQVRFVEAELEELGFVPEAVTRDVIRGELTFIEYLMPSFGDVLFDACAGTPMDQDTGVLTGTVVDDRGRPVPDATVRVQWSSYVQTGVGDLGAAGRADPNSLIESMSGFEYATDSGGTYRFCGVPTDERLVLTAASGDAESESYEVRIPRGEIGAIRQIQVPEG